MDRVKSIFQAAGACARAANCLNAAAGREWSLLLPSHVNAALALELYLKSLYHHVKGTDFKVNGRHSHDFHKLFGELSPDLKNTMQSDFRATMEHRNTHDIEQMEAASHVVIPREFADNLKVWSGVSVKMRYAYDKSSVDVPMMFFPEMEQVIRKAIVQYRPDVES